MSDRNDWPGAVAVLAMLGCYVLAMWGWPV